MEIYTEKPEKPTMLLFCARCGEHVEHMIRIDHNGEFVAECVGITCDRFLKFPRGHDFKETHKIMFEEIPDAV